MAEGEPAPGEEVRFYRATGPYGYLSNLFLRPIAFDGRPFRCSEEAYQWGKPKRADVAEWLVTAPSPHLCALAAHALLRWDVREDWQQIKVQRMRDVLVAKFAQHPDLAERLLATGRARLVEDSKMDAFWGTGKNGAGKNMLGVLLMEVRESLRSRPEGDRL